MLWNVLYMSIGVTGIVLYVVFYIAFYKQYEIFRQHPFYLLIQVQTVGFRRSTSNL